MARERVFRLEFDRRRWLKLGFTSAVAAWLPATPLDAQSPPQNCAPPIPQNHEPSNGSPCPYPIPWLDKNGNHNQAAMPNVELSSIYHFRGKLARCNGFHGMGTDNKGNRLAWGTPSTDYSYMAGEYWAARKGIEFGLVDRIGDLRSTLRERYGDKVETPLVAASRSLFGRIAPGVSAQIGNLFDRPALTDELISSLEARALWARFGL